jgi:hypothetical protein
LIVPSASRFVRLLMPLSLTRISRCFPLFQRTFGQSRDSFRLSSHDNDFTRFIYFNAGYGNASGADGPERAFQIRDLED